VNSNSPCSPTSLGQPLLNHTSNRFLDFSSLNLCSIRSGLTHTFIPLLPPDPSTAAGSLTSGTLVRLAVPTRFTRCTFHAVSALPSPFPHEPSYLSPSAVPTPSSHSWGTPSTSSDGCPTTLLARLKYVCVHLWLYLWLCLHRNITHMDRPLRVSVKTLLPIGWTSSNRLYLSFESPYRPSPSPESIHGVVLHTNLFVPESSPTLTRTRLDGSKLY
jgi:hypothetical protein